MDRFKNILSFKRRHNRDCSKFNLKTDVLFAH